MSLKQTLGTILIILHLFFGGALAFAQEADPAPLPPAEEQLAKTAPQQTTLARFNDAVFTLLFFDLARGSITIDKVDKTGQPVFDDNHNPIPTVIPIPFLIVFLLFGGIYFSVYHRFITLRGFRHSIDIVRGKFDNPDDPGEISHFRALTSALSATVGLGNIAGVAVAIQLGGPGAVFWMWITAIFGMASKFNSCTLAQLYRQVNADGSISGGPMYYLDLGFKSKGKVWAPIGKLLAVLFAIMVMGGAIGGGNMFQANQTVEAITDTFQLDQELALNPQEYSELLASHPQFRPELESITRVIPDTETIIVHLGDLTEDQQVAMSAILPDLRMQASTTARWGIGIILAILAGAVILGGIQRIGAATCRIVPIMCGIYIVAAIYILFTHAAKIPESFSLIFSMAFTQNAFYGGMIGVLIWGIKRAAFSNEAGLGSAAIAHAAAKTEEPVREGMVAMLGPFIDTILICTMTALVVIITDAWNDPLIPQSAGVSLTTAAFGSAISWFPYVLTACIALFAYSTMISWCYYGERGWIYLLDHLNGMGLKTVHLFRILFVGCIIIGATNTFTDVLNFSDAMILSMALPNILGGLFLANKVKEKSMDYWRRYRTGMM